MIDPPLLTEAKVIGLVNTPWQKVWFGIDTTCGVGLTVIVNVETGPLQLIPLPVNIGVTVIVAVWMVAELLMAAKAFIALCPCAFRPIEVKLFAQL